MKAMQAIRTLEQLARQHREYLQHIEPIVHHMAMLEALRPPPTIRIYSDGKIEVGPPAPLPPAAESALEAARQTIAAIRVAYFPELDATAPASDIPPPSR